MMMLLHKMFENKVTSKPLTIWESLIFSILFSCITVFFLKYGMDLALWVMVASISAIGIYIASPKLWIYSVLLSSYFFYTKGGVVGDESSSQPILFAMAYHLSLGVWIFSQILLKKIKLIRYWTDLLFFMYLGFTALNCILAISNGVQFIDWLKGWQLYLVILYYFPIIVT